MELSISKGNLGMMIEWLYSGYKIRISWEFLLWRSGLRAQHLPWPPVLTTMSPGVAKGPLGDGFPSAETHRCEGIDWLRNPAHQSQQQRGSYFTTSVDLVDSSAHTPDLALHVPSVSLDDEDQGLWVRKALASHSGGSFPLCGIRGPPGPMLFWNHSG